MPNGDYIAIDDEGLSYKLTIEYLNGALPGDVVGFAADKNDYYRVTDIIKRGKPNILCEVVKDGDSLKLKPRRINGKLNIYVPQDILKDIGLGNYALFKISEDEVNGFYDGEFVSKAEMTSALDNELSMIAFSNDFHEEFPQEVNDEVSTLPNQVIDKEKESRKNNDLRDDLCFTIDGINTQDMDDAVSAERLSNGNYKVRVYIADVAHYLKNLPATLKEARKRSTSLYLLNTVIHMIPEILSQGLCSLNENEDRLARVITMEIDKNGKVVNSFVEKCIMRSKKKMSYDAVNNILLDNEVPEGYEPYVDSLKLMEEITHILKKKAKDNGRMDIVEDEVSAIYGCDKSILDSSIPDRTIAQEIIACFMIEANATVASYFKDSVLPFIYRIHEGINRHTFRYFLKKLKNIELDEKNADKINNLNQLKKFFASITNPRDKKALSKLITTAFVNAKYSIHNLGHWALSLEAYTHFTSPI